MLCTGVTGCRSAVRPARGKVNKISFSRSPKDGSDRAEATESHWSPISQSRLHIYLRQQRSEALITTFSIRTRTWCSFEYPCRLRSSLFTHPPIACCTFQGLMACNLLQPSVQSAETILSVIVSDVSNPRATANAKLVLFISPSPWFFLSLPFLAHSPFPFTPAARRRCLRLSFE